MDDLVFDLKNESALNVNMPIERARSNVMAIIRFVLSVTFCEIFA